RVRSKTPEKDADVLNVVFALPCRDVPNVHCVRHRVEWSVDFLQRFPLPQVRRVKGVWANVIRRPLCPAEQLEKFHRARIPAGDIASELLQHRGCAFTTAETDGVRHFRALAPDLRYDVMQCAITDQ